MMMASGKRVHRVTVQGPSGSPVADGDGGYTQAYADLSPSTLYVSIEPATQRALERFAGGTAIADATHIVTAPYHAGVTNKTRLTFGTRTLYVVGVANPGERDRETVMVCREVVS